jgi:hypothetical protein
VAPSIKMSGSVLGVLLACTACLAQDLTPRAYGITPIRTSAILVTCSYFSGDLMLNGMPPITDATANVHVSILSYYHSFNFFGRSDDIGGE